MSTALERPSRALARAVAVGALIGAGVIHFAYVPTHMAEALNHGAFFLAAGWLQLALAAGLAFRVRPERIWLGLTVLINAAIVTTWVTSRTVGVPGADPEDVGLADGIATLLALVAVVAAAALAWGVLPERQLARRPAWGL
ncbi:MAG: hypothetical protein ACRDZ0_01615, partial [Acidimicrobiales bacterium]